MLQGSVCTHRASMLCGAALLLFAANAAAADEADFYKGKQIRLIASTGPGGVYDTFSRLLGQHMAAHLPGRPNIVVQNVPGASGLKATNYLYNDAPRDGTVIAGVHNGIPNAPFEVPQGVHFDVNKLSWLGSISEDPFVGYVWHNAPIKTFDDAKTTQVVMGSSSANSMGTKMAIISNAFFGTKLKTVTGYEDSSTVKLALEKGEIQGTFANSWGDLKTQQPDWIRDKKVRIIIQDGFHKDPELPDVPLIIDQAKTEADRQALEFMMARQDFARPYVAPPGLPPERLETLRRAFEATMRDPKFIAAVKAQRLEVANPMTGEQLAKRVQQLAATPASVTQRLTKLFDDYMGK